MAGRESARARMSTGVPIPGLLSGDMVACLPADTGSLQQAGSLRSAELALLSQLGSNEKPCLKV